MSEEDLAIITLFLHYMCSQSSNEEIRATNVVLMIAQDLNFSPTNVSVNVFSKHVNFPQSCSVLSLMLLHINNHFVGLTPSLEFRNILSHNLKIVANHIFVQADLTVECTTCQMSNASFIGKCTSCNADIQFTAGPFGCRDMIFCATNHPISNECSSSSRMLPIESSVQPISASPTIKKFVDYSFLTAALNEEVLRREVANIDSVCSMMDNTTPLRQKNSSCEHVTNVPVEFAKKSIHRHHFTSDTVQNVEDLQSNLAQDILEQVNTQNVRCIYFIMFPAQGIYRVFTGYLQRIYRIYRVFKTYLQLIYRVFTTYLQRIYNVFTA